MNLRLLLAALSLGWAAYVDAADPPANSAGKAKDPPRHKRSESFLGLHFDFHAGPDCREVGKNTTPEMVAAILDKVGPGYLQIDCKGHPGYSSYPTKVGNPVPGFVGDPLRVWRQVTAERGWRSTCITRASGIRGPSSSIPTGPSAMPTAR